MSERPTDSLRSRHSALDDPAEQLRTLRSVPLRREFDSCLGDAGLRPLRATGIEILQINVGKLCNMTCRHCHVDAGPDRTDAVMSRAVLERCLEALSETDIPTVDITGGAPELNPHFRWFVRQVKQLDRHVIDRCNLTVLLTGRQRDLPKFLAENDVEIVASLPHYRALNTDRQRGAGVFDESIDALRRLNEVGYGRGDPDHKLCLVTNPVGAFLPGCQASLEQEWKQRLYREHGVAFDQLYTITNMPISRFLEFLTTSGNLEAYMQRLLDAFNPAAAHGVMCRNTISVGWDGTLYDCDFNQMLSLPVNHGLPSSIHDWDAERLARREIVTGRHCFGCTAGAGSSCGGATTD
jgi:radical SAM/Cys-rich protein